MLHPFYLSFRGVNQLQETPRALRICKKAFRFSFILRLNEQALFVEEDILGMLLKMK